MRAKILGVLIALALVLVPTGVAATNTAEVAVTATPEFIGITVDPTTWGPSVPDGGLTVQTTTIYFTITNTSNVPTHQYIGVTAATWASAGQTWTHSNTAESGVHTVGMKANKGGTWGTTDVIVKYEATFTSLNQIATSQAATTDYDFGLQMIGPTANSDTVTKTNTVRITAVKNPTSKAAGSTDGGYLTIDGHGWTSFGG